MVTVAARDHNGPGWLLSRKQAGPSGQGRGPVEWVAPDAFSCAVKREGSAGVLQGGKGNLEFQQRRLKLFSVKNHCPL